MTKTLKEQYDSRQMILAEGFLDYFKTGSDNIQKFNSTLQQLKTLATTFKLQSLQGALNTANQQFEEIVMKQQQGEKPDQNKATALSKAVTFVSMMSTFMDNFKNVTTQLPSMKNALAQARDPQQGGKPLKDILGPDAAKFGQLISTQFQKSGGGIFKTIGRFFSGGGAQNPLQVLKDYGIDGTTFANDILNLTPSQLQQFTQQSASTQSFQLNAQPQAPAENAGTKPGEKTMQTAPPENAEASPQPAAATQPTAPAIATAAAPNQKPDQAASAKRDVAIQKAVRNRNAFNTQILGGLSNAEIAQDLQNLAKSLGIKL